MNNLNLLNYYDDKIEPTTIKKMKGKIDFTTTKTINPVSQIRFPRNGSFNIYIQ